MATVAEFTMRPDSFHGLKMAQFAVQGVRCFLKTSGSQGWHAVVPLVRRHDWNTVTQFSKALAYHLARTLPKRFSATMGEENRVEKIYIDYLRNSRMASTVIPYSTRAREGLPVAIPIAWDELDNIDGSTCGRSVRWRSACPWQDYFTARQRLTRRMREALGMDEDLD